MKLPSDLKEWLSNLALVTVDGEITAMGLQLADQLPGAIGAAIAQAAATVQHSKTTDRR